MIHIVLVNPEIPSNTGNIVRTCVATGTTLHLIRPLGFSTEDKMLKRAGLDYWYEASIHYYDSLQELQDKYPHVPMYYMSTKGSRVYSDVSYPQECMLVYGRETKGLDEQLLHDNYDMTVRVPMIGDTRSLNLSNTVALTVYEVYRQHGFEQFNKCGHLTQY